MRYLLDTCVISDFIKGEPGTQARLKQILQQLWNITIRLKVKKMDTAWKDLSCLK